MSSSREGRGLDHKSDAARIYRLSRKHGVVKLYHFRPSIGAIFAIAKTKRGSRV